MNNRELEGKLKSAVEKSTPDVWDRVQTDLSHGKGEIITMSDKKKKGKILSFVSSVAAALVLISAAVYGFANYNKADLKPVSTVYLEVNPQIELSLNTYDVVLEAIPKNEDGKKVLGSMELKEVQLDVALNAILGSMVKNGYLTKESNSVLISVQNENKSKANQINLAITKSVGNAIKADDFYYAAVVQTIEETAEFKAEADKLNITSGKANLINAIKENGAKASKEELAKLSVDDLNLIYQSHVLAGDEQQKVNYKGSVNQNKYIGFEKAKEIALNAAKVSEKDTKHIEIDYDFEKGKMVYEVEFEVGGREYGYEIDAVSGEILALQRRENKPQTGSNSSEPSSSSNSANSSKSSSSSKQSNTVSSKLDSVISPEDALKIALSHAGLSSSKVADVDVEFDEERGKYHYDVDFKYGGYEYEYEIDAVSGAVIKSDKERDD